MKVSLLQTDVMGLQRNCELQIENDPPFIPDMVYRAGNLSGLKEQTKPGDAVRSFTPHSMIAVIHYRHNGMEIEAYYRKGTWAAGSNNLPRFCVMELLTGE